ncbi:MAG: hypothetical protein GX239_00140 [Clostridiaceae bacterium]|nr:hypothetical protein [Clostridiaceae bacterium]
MAETKREKFVRIAEARTNKIISMIQLLGNCSNRAAYDYTEKDVNAIINAIDKELKLAKQKFVSSGEKQRNFKLEK